MRSKIPIRFLRKRLCLTQAVTARIEELNTFCKGMTYGELADFGQQVGIWASGTLYDIVRKHHQPSIGIYLKLGRYFKWDISRDVNYIFVTQRYGRRDINAMLREINPHCETTNQMAELLASELPYSRGSIYEVLKMYCSVSCNVYNEVLRYIRRECLELDIPCDIDLED